MFVLLRYVTNKTDTFVMFKEILEINKKNTDQNVTEQFEIFVNTCGCVRQVRSTGGHTAC